MLKRSKIAILMVVLAIAVLVIPASAFFSYQDVETRAQRSVDIADGALGKVVDLVSVVEANSTIMGLISDAGLVSDFYGNVSRCLAAGEPIGTETTSDDGDGLVFLNAAKDGLLVAETEDDYRLVIDNAKEALVVFRDVFRAINVVLIDVGVDFGEQYKVEVIQEAIDRSFARVDELKVLISVDAPIYVKLIDAETNLNDAAGFLPDNLDDAKSSLRNANVLISEVCSYLREVARELNPQRIRGFCENVYRYRERFRGRFREALDEGFDVDGFLQRFGYQSEEDFMAKFKDLVQNAESIDDLVVVFDELKQMGRIVRDVDARFNFEMGRFRARRGFNGSGYGFGD